MRKKRSEPSRQELRCASGRVFLDLAEGLIRSHRTRRQVDDCVLRIYREDIGSLAGHGVWDARRCSAWARVVAREAHAPRNNVAQVHQPRLPVELLHEEVLI